MTYLTRGFLLYFFLVVALPAKSEGFSLALVPPKPREVERPLSLEEKIELFNRLQTQQDTPRLIESADEVMEEVKDLRGNVLKPTIYVRLTNNLMCRVVAQDQPVLAKLSRINYKTETEEAPYNYQYKILSLQCINGESVQLIKSVEAADWWDHLDPGPNNGEVKYEIVDGAGL